MTTEKIYRNADQEYKQSFQALLNQYGTATNIPTEKIQQISEINRAKCILGRYPDEEEVTVLRKFSVGQNVITLVTGKEVAQPSPKAKRTDKYAHIADWCKENVGTETTIYDIAEAGKVSYPTANNFVKTRPDLFTKVKKGSYIIRDPEAERALEKK